LNESELKKIVLVSPATAQSNNGNWHTAHRWSRFLSSHFDTALLTNWSPALHAGSAPGAMIALHAGRSAVSIAHWAQTFPDKPLIVLLTGTDLYRDITVDAAAQRSIASATHLVVLQDAGLLELPLALRSKTSVIYQSARALRPARKATRVFTALMVGHLRDEKDPLTFMRAARQSLESKTRFVHIGAALDDALGRAAEVCAKSAPHYRWLGALPHAATRQHIRRAHVLVICSKMEGGAHVVLEAIRSHTPVLASRISGNIGMLGADYAGYFTLGDDTELATLVNRCRHDVAFMKQLTHQCRLRAPLFTPEHERSCVLNLLSRSI
jgi:putative glycosyltransferase (TIGR04348 family)